MHLVKRLCIWSGFENPFNDKFTEMVYGFDFVTPINEDVIEEHVAKFGEDKENEQNSCVTMDFSGSEDPTTKLWSNGFSPCNLTDDPTDTLVTARKKVKDMTNDFRDYIISKGFGCTKITKGE